MQLQVVSDYVQQARILLQDLVPEFRYDDASLVTALNNAFLEMERLRPDILMSYNYLLRQGRNLSLNPPTVPSYTELNQTALVYIPTPYRMALLYYICGFAQIRDMQDVQDARASLFMGKFHQIMAGAG